MINHHPPFDLLVDFATGSVSEPVALAVASHAEWCSQCRAQIAEIEGIGGALLDTIAPVDMEATSLDALMARLDEPEEASDTVTNLEASPDLARLPSALRRYVAAGLERLPWKKVGGLFEEARLPISVSGYKAALMRLKPGAVMPQHTHRGVEYTMVLAGGYSDGGRQFLPGDFDVKDPSHVHKPVVDEDEDCLCLVVLDAPVKLTGAVGRIVNPFLRV